MKFVSERLDMYYQNIFIKIRKFYHFFKKVIVFFQLSFVTTEFLNFSETFDKY